MVLVYDRFAVFWSEDGEDVSEGRGGREDRCAFRGYVLYVDNGGGRFAIRLEKGLNGRAGLLDVDDFQMAVYVPVLLA